MPLIADRVVETSTSTGIGSISLDGPDLDHEAFRDAFATAAKVFYVISQTAAAWEVGLGTLTHGGPDTLSRDSVLQSSNGDALVNFGAGTKNVFCAPPGQFLAGLVDMNKGAARPVWAQAGTPWIDDNAAVWVMKMFDGVDDITLGSLDPTANTFTPNPAANSIVLRDGSELTIAAGAITPTANYHTVDTEADAATDDLTDIVTTNIADGGLLVIRAVNAARTVVVKHSAAAANKVVMVDGLDITLDDTVKAMTLQRRGNHLEQLSAGPRPALTASFTSAEQTITAAGSLTIAHGLTVVPTLIQARIICKVAAQGYAIGDEVVIHANAGVNANEGIAIWPDATNLNVRFGSNTSVFFVSNKTTGGQALLTVTSWKLIVRAWA